MLQYEKIDASEGTDVKKTSASKDVGFKSEEHICNRCHDLLTMANSLKNIAILSVKGATLRYLMMGTSKIEALKKLNNSVTYNRGVLQI